jgi:hypothetical protein
MTVNGAAPEETAGSPADYSGTLVPVFTKLAPTSQDAIATVERFCDELLKLPQIRFVTEHMLHGGIYTRTIRLPAYTAIVAVLIKVPTSLIFAGEADIYTNGDLVRVNGYSVLPGSSMRKVAAVTYSDFAVSMMFATDAKTVEDAEKEFTDEYDLLVPLSEQDRHTILLTGE